MQDPLAEAHRPNRRSPHHGDRQGRHGLLEQRPFSEGEQGWQVRPTGGPADARPGQQVAAVGYRRPGEPRVTRGTSPLGPLEADEAGANPLQGRWGLPAPWGHVPEGLLQLSEVPLARCRGMGRG